MLIIEITKLELIGDHIRNLQIIAMAKTELTGDQLGFVLILKIAKIEFTEKPYWKYANDRNCQNKIHRRPY